MFSILDLLRRYLLPLFPTFLGEKEKDSTLNDLRPLHAYLWGNDRINRINSDGNSFATLDLALFNLSLNLRPDYFLLVRNEYDLAYDAIVGGIARAERTSWKRSAALVTGQPGIGKTLFLFYVLARRLQEKQPTAVQLDPTRFALFDESGVSLQSSLDGRVPPGAWTLSDTMNEQPGPCLAFKTSKGHVINTSSPKSSKEWVKQLGAREYIMDVWSLEEFQRLLMVSNLNLQDGALLYQKFGSNPRIIVNILASSDMEVSYLRDVYAGANRLAVQFIPSFLQLESLDFSSSDLPSKIIMVRPDLAKSRAVPALFIPTPFLSTLLGVAMSRTVATTQHTFFTMLNGHPSLRAAAGWLFENYAHTYISDPHRGPFHAYLRGDSVPHDIPGAESMIAGNTKLSHAQPPFSFYWRTREPNFRGIDAVIRVENVVWALQFTVGTSHRSAADDLSEVHRIINHKQTIEEWRLVMVGPRLHDAEAARDSQKLGGKWIRTPVYACELPLCEFSEENAQRLQGTFNDEANMYPAVGG